LREGIDSRNIYVTGNPIREIIEYYKNDLYTPYKGLDEGKYFLVTLHRQENVDDPVRLSKFMAALSEVRECYDYPMVFSVHPRTRSKIQSIIDSNVSGKMMYSDPMSFKEFLNLELNAFCVLSDSGTVQEECCIYGVPNVTLRDVTERPETVECGSNFIAGCDSGFIQTGVNIVTKSRALWKAPPEYMRENVSRTVINILLSK